MKSSMRPTAIGYESPGPIRSRHVALSVPRLLAAGAATNLHVGRVSTCFLFAPAIANSFMNHNVKNMACASQRRPVRPWGILTSNPPKGQTYVWSHEFLSHALYPWRRLCGVWGLPSKTNTPGGILVASQVTNTRMTATRWGAHGSAHLAHGSCPLSK